MAKQRDTNDSFVEQSPQCIGTEHKPGSGHFYMKPEGPPELYGFYGHGGVTDGHGYRRSSVLHWQTGFGRFVGNPLAIGVKDDSMGRAGNLIEEDSGGY